MFGSKKPFILFFLFHFWAVNVVDSSGQRQITIILYCQDNQITTSIVYLVSKEEGQQQCPDMSTIHISICQNYDFMITEGVFLEIFPLKAGNFL